MSSLQQELGIAISLDSSLLHQSVASGKESPVDEILSLASGVQALFIVVTLASRELAHIEDRRALWAEVADLYDELCLLWSDPGSDDPRIKWLTGKLRDLRALAQDEARIYEIRPSERKRHAMCREDDVSTFRQRNESVPDGYRDQSSPAHVYQLGRL
jgi:hypothetical protein